MEKVLFIYNPFSGKGLIKPKLGDIIDIIVKAGFEPVVYPTQSYRDAYKKVQEYTSDYKRIICSGGDGTLDEVVSGMMLREDKIPIGYIPAGTTNDFASSLHIPNDMLSAAHIASSGVPFPCDIGQFNKGTFVYIAAFGLFTDVSYETRQEMKNLMGHMAYLLEGVTRLFDIPSYHIKVSFDGETIEDDFIYGMVTNSRSVGGFRQMIGKNVVFDDGLFEVTLIKTPKTIEEIGEIVTSLVSGSLTTDHIVSFRTSNIRFESIEEIPWTLDGEFGGQYDTVNIQNRQKALKIMVSQEYMELRRERGLED